MRAVTLPMQHTLSAAVMDLTMALRTPRTASMRSSPIAANAPLGTACVVEVSKQVTGHGS